MVVIGTIIFSRTFAHVGIVVAGLPVYVTEFALIVLCVGLFVHILLTRKVRLPSYPAVPMFILWYALMCWSLLQGYLRGYDTVHMLRHAGIVYYSFLFFLVPLVFDTMRRIDRFFVVSMLAALVATLVPALGIDGGVGGYRYFYGSLVLIMLGAQLLYQRPAHWRILAAAIFAVSVLQGQARASWVGLLAAGIAAMVLLRIGRFTRRIDFVKFLSVVGAGLLVTGVSLVLLRPGEVPATYNKVVSILMIKTQDSVNQGAVQNAQWRLYVWKDMLSESMQRPVLGWGFGKYFIPKTIQKLGWGGSWRAPTYPGDPLNRGFQDPHNSYLSVLHRMGLLGLTLFLLILFVFSVTVLRCLRAMEDGHHKVVLAGLLLMFVFITVLSFFMVSLEGPYLGMFLWIVMGLSVSVMRIWRLEHPQGTTAL